jgi:hypothetical protein
MDASEVTRRLRERAIYASFITQRNRVDGGCSNSVRLQNVGVGAFDSSLIPAIKEGDLYTTPEEAQAVIDANACEPVIVPTHDAIYMVGQFALDPITFFAAQDEISLDLYKNDVSTNRCAFLVKFNLNGTPLWSTRINSIDRTSSEPSCGIDKPIVYVSNNSKIIVAGYAGYSNNTDNSMYFYSQNDLSTPTITIDHTVSSAHWIAQYNSQGIVEWATHLTIDEGESFDNRSYVTTDSQNNVYLITSTGDNEDINVFNAGNSSTAVQTISLIDGDDDVYFIKYNSTGQYQWHSILSTPNWEMGASIKCDRDDNIYVITSPYGSSTLNIYTAPSYNTPSFTANLAGDPDGYSNVIVKYSSSGSILWWTQIAGSKNAIRCGTAIDSSNNLYILSMYQITSVNLYSQNDQTTPAFTLNNSGGWDTLLVKYSSTGTALWVSRISGSGNEQQPSLSIDSSDNLYVTSESNSASINIYNAGSSTPSRTCDFNELGNNKIFIIKYNSSGISQWVSFIGSFLYNQTRNESKVIPDGSLYMVFRMDDGNTINFYNSSGNAIISSISNNSGHYTIVFVKYDTNGTPIWCTQTTNGDLPQVSI